jgi:membrane-associated phospholipid phosphatase
MNDLLAAVRRNPFIAGEKIGETYTIFAAAATVYIIGRRRRKPRLEHLGWDEMRTALLGQVVAVGIKAIIRRHRPLRPNGTRQSGFSFPSGHATVTFAAATVLQRRLGYRAGIAAYAIASYVAASRLHDNRHYLSDVVFGAAMGIVIGRSVA